MCWWSRRDISRREKKNKVKVSIARLILETCKKKKDSFGSCIRNFTRMIISACFALQTWVSMKGIWYLPPLAWANWHFTNCYFQHNNEGWIACHPSASFIKVAHFPLNWNEAMKRTTIIYEEKDTPLFKCHHKSLRIDCSGFGYPNSQYFTSGNFSLYWKGKFLHTRHQKPRIAVHRNLGD